MNNRWKNSEIISLASDGFFYTSDHPFYKGVATIYPITGRCEDILSNATLKKYNIVTETLLNEVLEEKVDIKDILQCDLETILLNLKILSYGKETNFKITCPYCDTTSEETISFSFKPKKFDFSQYEKGENKLVYVFKDCGKKVYYRLPTTSEYNFFVKNGWLPFIKNQIVSIDDVSDIEDFMENELSIMDNKRFKSNYFDNCPGFITKSKISCKKCEKSKEYGFDINSDIFGSGTEFKKVVHSDIFTLCYHTNGAFTYSDVYDMPVNQRNFYINKLIELREADKKSRNTNDDKNSTGMTPDRSFIKP